MPNFSATEPPPSTYQADLREDLGQSPPLNPDIVPFEAEKGHWTEEGCKGPDDIGGKTVLHPSAYVDLRLRGLTPCPSTMISPSKPVFQRTSGSLDQPYLDQTYQDPPLLGRRQ